MPFALLAFKRAVMMHSMTMIRPGLPLAFRPRIAASSVVRRFTDPAHSRQQAVFSRSLTPGSRKWSCRPCMSRLGQPSLVVQSPYSLAGLVI